MKSGYKIYWSDNALNELKNTIEYLEQNFSDKEIKRLVQKLEHTIQLLSKNPHIFPESEFKNIHRAVVLKYNSLYYRIKGNKIEILSFFSNRQSPNKRKI